MPGIRFLDARGGPVIHDAVLPFEPGGVALSEVYAELVRRMGTSGIDEKKSRGRTPS